MPTPRRAFLAAITLAAALLPGCVVADMLGLRPTASSPDEMREVPSAPAESDRIRVRHVQIAFDGLKVRGVTRTEAEAKALAERVLQLARSGRDFGELVRLYSDDHQKKDGAYAITNWGVVPAETEVGRDELPAAFTAAAFQLAPGQLTLVPYDKDTCRSGYHVVRRD